jgi:hypothetical protein
MSIKFSFRWQKFFRAGSLTKTEHSALPAELQAHGFQRRRNAARSRAPGQLFYYSIFRRQMQAKSAPAGRPRHRTAGMGAQTAGILKEKGREAQPWAAKEREAATCRSV